MDVINEVDLAREAMADFSNQLREQLRAERKAQKAEKRDERKAAIMARFDEIKARRAERKAAISEAKDIANAQYISSTKEMLGTE